MQEQRTTLHSSNSFGDFAAPAVREKSEETRPARIVVPSVNGVKEFAKTPLGALGASSSSRGFFKRGNSTKIDPKKIVVKEGQPPVNIFGGGVSQADGKAERAGSQSAREKPSENLQKGESVEVAPRNEGKRTKQ